MDCCYDNEEYEIDQLLLITVNIIVLAVLIYKVQPYINSSR